MISALSPAHSFTAGRILPSTSAFCSSVVKKRDSARTPALTLRTSSLRSGSIFSRSAALVAKM
ncbi:hypothetical protein D3C87_2168630 [compost metagenome]